MSGCLNVETLSILNNYVPQKLACIISTYRRNWLLSARAYNTQQQENMFLTKSMHITGSMCLENMILIFLFYSLPLESCNRSLVVQVACWAYVPNKEQ